MDTIYVTIINECTVLTFSFFSFFFVDGIWRCIQLQTLRLPGNQLVTLPETLGRVMTLTELDVTGNRLIQLPRSLGDCAILKKLFICKKSYNFFSIFF